MAEKKERLFHRKRLVKKQREDVSEEMHSYNTSSNKSNANTSTSALSSSTSKEEMETTEPKPSTNTPIEDFEEFLQLGLEEAFFLQHILKCLRIFDEKVHRLCNDSPHILG